MLKVHVWPPNERMVGHASIAFGTSYVSFWPQGAATAKDLKIKRSHPGAINNSLAKDIELEGDRQPITIVIPNINETKLSLFVTELIANTPRYQLARYNCSHVVAECLEVACGKKPSFHPCVQNYGRLGKILGRGIWTPGEILRYAKELAAR